MLAHRSSGDMVLAISSGGTVTGTAFGDTVFGFWNDPAPTLTFVRAPKGGAADACQLWTGYRCAVPFGGGTIDVMAGTLCAFSGTGG